MTEDDAKTKWCPHARVVTYAADGEPLMTATNRVSGGVLRAGSDCIASACMSWRWTQRSGTPRNHGYCGLAGRPE